MAIDGYLLQLGSNIKILRAKIKVDFGHFRSFFSSKFTICKFA